MLLCQLFDFNMLTMIIFSSTQINYNSLGKQHNWNADNCSYYKYFFERSLSGPKKEIFFIISCHIDKDGNHGTDNGRGFSRVFINTHPFVDDEIVHIDEGASHE